MARPAAGYAVWTIEADGTVGLTEVHQTEVGALARGIKLRRAGHERVCVRASGKRVYDSAALDQLARDVEIEG